jgi:Transposase DDE domain
VHVWEPNPPDNVEPVEWFLYTTEPIKTADQQLAVVDYYRARWTIEEYFKAIKTGCNFERRQLRDYEALTNLLAVFAPIAYRLLLIRSEATRVPHEPHSDLVSSDHLDVLRAQGRIPLPPQPTNIYLAIAALGGHIKYSGDPGWLTFLRGYEKLEILVERWRSAKLQLPSDQS